VRGARASLAYTRLPRRQPLPPKGPYPAPPLEGGAGRPNRASSGAYEPGVSYAAKAAVPPSPAATTVTKRTSGGSPAGPPPPPPPSRPPPSGPPPNLNGRPLNGEAMCTQTDTHTGTDVGASRTGTRPRRTAQQCVLCAAGARTVSGGVVHAAASEPRGADSDRKQCATAAAQAASPHLPHVVRPAGGRASRSAHQAEPASAPRCRHGAVARSRVRACVCACAFGWAPWPGEEHECLQPAAPRAGPRDLPARHRPGISAHQPRT
jgi:hypothetical protein